MCHEHIISRVLRSSGQMSRFWPQDDYATILLNIKLVVSVIPWKKGVSCWTFTQQRSQADSKYGPSPIFYQIVPRFDTDDRHCIRWQLVFHLFNSFLEYFHWTFTAIRVYALISPLRFTQNDKRNLKHDYLSALVPTLLYQSKWKPIKV